MDDSKCRALKAELAARPTPWFIEAERFFDGNDDPHSIGRDRMTDRDPIIGRGWVIGRARIESPSMDAFRDVFASLLRRPDVQAVYAQIVDFDPGDDRWPFTDTFLVVGAIPKDDLCKAISSLEPECIADAAGFGVSPAIGKKHGTPVLAVWWD